MADKTSIIKDAHKYLSRGQIDKAIAEWEKLIKDSPDGNTYNIIGDLYLKKGDRKSAVDSFHQAANFFRNEGFSLKALALYKKVLNINPSESDALYSLGQLSEEKGLVTDAIKYYLATADSLSKEGKKDRILDIYTKILSLSPSNIPLRNKVAEIFIKEGLKADASKEYIYIAGIYDEKGETENAKEYYDKALDIQPLNKEAVMGIGYLYEKSGEVEKAIEHMREAAVLFHSDKEVLFRYAELSMIGGQNEIAKQCLRKIIDDEPNDTKSRRLLGDIYLKEGSKEEAWTEYLPVIDDLILEEKYDDAIKFLGHFKEIDPLETGKRLVSLYRQLGENETVAAELAGLGDALREEGLSDDALGCYKEALEIKPDDAHLRKVIDELTGKPEVPEEKEMDVPPPVTEGEKTLEEIFVEADIFSRYGLLSEAVRILEGQKLRNPQNIDLHKRLKSLYIDISERESAVTECLILSELYKRQGDKENYSKMLKDAYEILPEDPRLAERGIVPSPETEGAPAFAEREHFPEAATEQRLEDYEEDLAEADFYARQGLIQEAGKILEKMHGLFPDNKDIRERLENLGHLAEMAGKGEVDAALGEKDEIPDSTAFIEENLQEKETKDRLEIKSELSRYEDFTLTDNDLVEAQEMPEPSLDSDVLDIFQEFKKGLEKELGDEDSETHYNLGIAYKEMGLIDDAIKEFQTSREDPKRAVQSLTMLGVCYMEKGIYSLAVDSFSKALKNVGEGDDSYWAISYDLAEAYEKNNNLKEALDLYTGVFGWNAAFRNVSEKVGHLRTQLAKGAEPEKPKARKDRVSYL